MVEEENDEEVDNEDFDKCEAEANPNEIDDEISTEQFDPNETESDEEQEEFDPNDPDEEIEPEQFDPNEEIEEEGEKSQSDFDPNEPEGNIEQEEFDPNESKEAEEPDQFNPNEGSENSNESDQYEMGNDNESDYDPYEYGNNFEQEGYSGDFENSYANIMSTILLTENQMCAYLKQYVKAMLKNEIEQVKQEEKNEGDNLENEPSELEQFLEQEKERIRLEQQEAQLDKTVDNESEPGSITNEEDVEQEREKLEPQVDSSEEISPINEEDKSHQKDQEGLIDPEELEPATKEEKVEQEQEKLEPQVDSSEEKSPNNQEEINKKANELELEQINSKEEEFDNQEMECEELQVNNTVEELDNDENAEQKEFEYTQETNMHETEIVIIQQEEEELELREIEEIEDHQQELDEILEQVNEIEQKALTIIEQEQEQEQEQMEKSRRESKGEQTKEQEIEQEKEEEWLKYLVNWVKEESGEEINIQMKDDVIEIIEKYNELDELTAKFQELYQKEQTEQLSHSEKLELKALIETLQKSDPSNIVLFTNIRAIKHYLTRQKLEKPQLNQILKHFFTRFSPTKQLNRILKANNKKLTIQTELFEKFIQYTHNNELIKNIVKEFNKSNRWMVNLRHTQTFINFVRKKINQLKNKSQAEILAKYLSLIIELKETDSISKAIKNLILKNKGNFNAYDIQNWLLISDVAALNQLKKMFTEVEYQTFVRTQEHVSISTIEEIARKKGGKCLSKTIKNAKSKIHLECIEGHKFSTTYNSVVYSNTWCPKCHIYVSESVCRQFCERIFKRPFPKSYPPWLVNRNGNQMELDGNNNELRLAFEYQGIQHRKKAFGLSEEEIKKIQEEDAYKLQKCKENGVLLLQIPDEEIVAYEEMQKFIIQEYESKSGKTLGNVPKYNYREFTIYENEHAKKFRAYIEQKGGTLLTPYLTAKKEVTILCEQGHQWTTTPDSIYRNNWCSECSGNKKGTTEEYQKIGEKFQCELLNEYVNAKTPLRYKCQKGHVFTRRPYWLKRTYKEIKNICPKCEREKFAEKFQIVVRNRGGILLTPYKGRFKPIKIKCEKEHEWNTTPAVVYQGSWCKTCANENNPNKRRMESAEQEFLKKMKSLNYTILSKYENNTKQVQIKCQRNHTFTMTPKYFKQLVNQKNQPCVKCRKNK